VIKHKLLPSNEILHEYFDYNPETGKVTWKKRTHPNAKRIKIGGETGSPSTYGYLYIHIFGVSYMAHRLIWKWMTGKEPWDEIDHIDCNVSNNTWVNLREATSTQNSQNIRIKATNTHGNKGITQLPSGSWRAMIGINYKRISIGVYKTKEEALKARIEYAEKVGKEFAREGDSAKY